VDEWAQLREASVQLSTYNRCVLSHGITILLVNYYVNTNDIIIIYTAFERAVERAKLENFQVQDCRHMFASWLVMAGISLQAVKDLLGHSSLTMTMRYAHLSPAHLREAVAKLDAPAGADGLTPAAAAPRGGEFSTISACRVSAAVESGGDCRGTS